MELISNFLLVAGAVLVGAYCMVISRRLKRFTGLENGMGGAIAVLSSQVDELTQTIVNAQKSAEASAGQLGDLTGRAEVVSRKLELMLAALDDMDVPPQPRPGLFSSERSRIGDRQ